MMATLDNTADIPYLQVLEQALRDLPEERREQLWMRATSAFPSHAYNNNHTPPMMARDVPRSMSLYSTPSTTHMPVWSSSLVLLLPF